MRQNRIALNYPQSSLDAIDAALDVLDTEFANLIGLTNDERRQLNKMGDKSEAFCRSTLGLLGEAPEVVPPGLNVTDALQDLAQLDFIRGRTRRVRRLLGRLEDSETALGSDVMTASLAGYAMLKVMGKGSGLEALRGGVARRFTRSRPAGPDAQAPKGNPPQPEQ